MGDITAQLYSEEKTGVEIRGENIVEAKSLSRGKEMELGKLKEVSFEQVIHVIGGKGEGMGTHVDRLINLVQERYGNYFLNNSI